MKRPVKFLRLSIAAGSGEDRICNAVLVAGAFLTIADDSPSLSAMLNGLTQLRRWAYEYYPDRQDWVVGPVESLVHWPKEDDDA